MEITLVRHGQAGVVGKDYDELSTHGLHQAAKLGENFNLSNRIFPVYSCGSLQRQRQTLAAFGADYQEDRVDARWNEFQPEVWRHVVQTAANHDNQVAKMLEGMQEARLAGKRMQAAWYFLQLTWRFLDDWYEIPLFEDKSLETQADFQSRIFAALIDLSESAKQQNETRALAVTSAMVIATIVGKVLEIPLAKVKELLPHIANSSVTVLQAQKDGWQLVSFNQTQHLALDELTLL